MNNTDQASKSRTRRAPARTVKSTSAPARATTTSAAHTRTPASPSRVAPAPAAPAPGGGNNLADILERVLDKGIVIAGDVRINLLDIELLTIKIRLVVASVERAEEMGLDWWRSDPMFSSRTRELTDENARLRERIERLEARDDD
ncbi:gas vesicle protein [Luteipulveratus sp. YIM 133132]|nr:gas vesicle protein [Luteipulveratus sp. YIM 133132]MDE9366916.1 gas vesicle protein [Luteipulveratus sp. YIM 133132]